MTVETLQHAVCMPRILITGLPGVGKTTLFHALAEHLADFKPAGFYTEEIRNEQGIREGFRLVTLCGRQLVLSHIHHPGPHRVSRYGVDVAGFEHLLAQLDLGHAQSPLIMIDEIGKMECLSRRFRADMTTLLNQSKMLIATIALKDGRRRSRGPPERRPEGRRLHPSGERPSGLSPGHGHHRQSRQPHG